MERAGRLIGKLRQCATNEELARAGWPAAVGKRIAAHAAAVALDGSRLVVEVEDAVWQGHLATLQSHILRRLEEVIGRGVVAEIGFRPMLPRRMPRREEISARPGKAGPADEADSIADPDLRRIYKISRRRASA